MSFENIERCLENLQCLLGIQGGDTGGFEPFDHQLLSRHYTFLFGNVACRSSEDTFVGRLHHREYTPPIRGSLSRAMSGTQQSRRAPAECWRIVDSEDRQDHFTDRMSLR
jgi:hypothetical protein